MQKMMQLGGFGEIERFFNLLLTKGPARGYFPESTKSIIIVKPAMVERAKVRFNHLGIEVVTGTRYLGSFFRSTAGESFRIRKKLARRPPVSPASSPLPDPPHKPLSVYSIRVTSSSDSTCSV